MPQQPAHTFSDRGLALIRSFEGLRLCAYQDSAGIWTIGYGHTGPEVHPGQRITHEEADNLLRHDVQTSVDCVNRLVSHALTQGQFDALVNLCYNIGQGNFARSSVLAKVSSGDLTGAAEAFGEWTRAGGKVLSGLVRRRSAEATMFRGGKGV